MGGICGVEHETMYFWASCPYFGAVLHVVFYAVTDYKGVGLMPRNLVESQ